MVATAQTAVKRAQADHFNTPGTCQMWTRLLFGAPSAGDQDGDGDADAVDGWKSEPLKARHTNRQPPKGAPVAWSGGRSGFGHRAISVGQVDGVYYVRSTDAGGAGKVATVPLGWVEQHWGLNYLGWSETIDGIVIPGLKIQSEPKPKPEPPIKKLTSRGVRVDESIKVLTRALRQTKDEQRQRLLKRALLILERIPKIK
jgi:hypothetical protein